MRWIGVGKICYINVIDNDENVCYVLARGRHLLLYRVLFGYTVKNTTEFIEAQTIIIWVKEGGVVCVKYIGIIYC